MAFSWLVRAQERWPKVGRSCAFFRQVPFFCSTIIMKITHLHFHLFRFCNLRNHMSSCWVHVMLLFPDSGFCYNRMWINHLPFVQFGYFWRNHLVYCQASLTNFFCVFVYQGAASAAGRKVTVLRDAGAACDHTIDPSYPEGKYLSNILLRVLWN